MLSAAPRPDKGYIRAAVPTNELTKEAVKRLGLYDFDKGVGQVLGRYIRARVTKSKLALTLDMTADFYLDFRRGVHPWEGLAEQLIVEGLLKTGTDGLSDFEMAGKKFPDKKAWLTWLSEQLNKGDYDVVGLGERPGVDAEPVEAVAAE